MGCDDRFGGFVLFGQGERRFGIAVRLGEAVLPLVDGAKEP